MTSVVRPCGDALELGLDRLLGARVERGGRLVEDQDARIFQQRARDRHALLLAAGELEAALADLGFVLLRKRFDEVVDVRRARGLDRLPRRSRRGGRSGCCRGWCR